MIQEAHPALAPERRDRIRILVREDGVVRVEDLRKNLNVSVATIRRDLEILEEEGKVKRVHGGAVSMESRQLLRMQKNLLQSFIELIASAIDAKSLLEARVSDCFSTICCICEPLGIPRWRGPTQGH